MSEKHGLTRRDLIKNSAISLASTVVCQPALLNVKDAFGFASAQELGMFCYQCEQTADGTGCTKIGVCGKKPEIAALHDLLIHSLKGLSVIAAAARQKGVDDVEVNRFVPAAMFSTLTNVDFDPKRFVALIQKTVDLRERLRKKAGVSIDNLPVSGFDLYKDAVGLTRAPDFVWERYEEPVADPPRAVVRPPAIEKREAARQRTLVLRKGQRLQPDAEPAKPVQSLRASFVGTLEKAYTWQDCPVPLNAVINREINDEGKEDFWVLVTTRLWKQSLAVRTLYGLRPAIEERHRQIKCFWNLTDFKSCSFALILNQVVFLALTYTLLQVHLYLRQRAELNGVTKPRLLQMLTSTVSVIIVYYQRRFARLTIGEYSQILLTVEGEAKQKLLARIRRLKDGVEPNLLNPRPPP
jgi:hypothetical protein